MAGDVVLAFGCLAVAGFVWRGGLDVARVRPGHGQDAFGYGDRISMQNRQSGRRRRGGSNNPRPMGMAANQGNASRQEGRVRGNASQLLEKYKVMARDAHQAGDRVAAEYYLQHADHYFRVLNDSRIRQDEMRARRGAFDQMDDEPDDDEDGDDDGQNREGQNREGQNRDGQNRDDRGRDERAERPERRDRGPRERSSRARPSAEERAGRDDRHDRDRDRDSEPARPRAARAERVNGRRDDREDQEGRADQMALSDGEAALAAFGGVADAESAPAPAPKRRGRPRKVVAEADVRNSDADGDDGPPAADG